MVCALNLQRSSGKDFQRDLRELGTKSYQHSMEVRHMTFLGKSILYFTQTSYVCLLLVFKCIFISKSKHFRKL